MRGVDCVLYQLITYFSNPDLDNHPHLLSPAQLNERESELEAMKQQELLLQKEQHQGGEGEEDKASAVASGRSLDSPPSLFDTDSKVIEELECPVCLEDMRPPRQIYSCSNAHLFCQRCNILELKSCPKCREDFRARKPDRNRLAERWACKIFQ